MNKVLRFVTAATAGLIATLAGVLTILIAMGIEFIDPED